MSVRISTPRMTQEPSIRLWEERIFGLINSLTGLLTVLMAPRPSRELPPPQVPANWAVLRILAQSPLLGHEPTNHNSAGGHKIYHISLRKPEYYDILISPEMTCRLHPRS